ANTLRSRFMRQVPGGHPPPTISLPPMAAGAIQNAHERKSFQMNHATQALQQIGQSFGLDNIARTLLRSGTLATPIRALISGLANAA
ncbi:hypothetical protein, partial [Tabrizicola sp.]|uniref:hypothetical protein n=1 Tax=Tabrizicola sp. TaxID=2005166 RepID=UPI00286B0803